MKHSKKFYLINIDYDGFIEGHRIVFNMPGFCSGDYSCIIQKDEKGLFIPKEESFFEGCRGFEVIPPDQAHYVDMY